MSFFNPSKRTPIRTQTVPQNIETPVTFVSTNGAYVRYTYSRSSDSINNQVEGQDYLCFRYNDQRLTFVVADGVGSSFCGNLAARIVGDQLLDWLWSLDIEYYGSPSALSEAAVSFLNRIQKQAQHEVEEYEIPSEVTGLIRQALESQRAYGSEAIFAAARIDYPSELIPNGLVSVFWMGDTQIHVRDEMGKELDIGGRWENANRWSTVQGVRGQMTAWMHELKGVGRVTSFSDGLMAHAHDLLGYSDSKLNREIYLGARLPTSDDVSFIDVVLRTPRYEGYPNPDEPDLDAERPHLEPIWNPTGQSSYEIRWTWQRGDSGDALQEPMPRFLLQEGTNPALPDAKVIDVPADQLSWRSSNGQSPGHYYYRVRAILRSGIVTPWSDLRQTRVAYPPPVAPQLTVINPEQAPILQWEAEGEGLEYTLQQAREEDFSDAVVVYDGRGTSWSVPMHQSKPGAYYYRVRAKSDGGEGPWSDPQSVEIVLPPPPKSQLGNPSYGYTPGNYDLRWQPVPGATYYELEQVEQASGEEELIRVEDTTISFTSQAVGDYSYRVRACHDFGCGEWSNVQRVQIAPVAPTDAPELSLEGPDDDDVYTLSWTGVVGATSYIIETSEDASFDNARVYSQNETSLTVARREPGTVYVRVCGTNRGGDSPWSNAVHIRVEAPSPGWIEAKLDAPNQQINLAWGAIGGRTTYRVEMASVPANDDQFELAYEGDEVQTAVDVPDGALELIFRVRAEAGGIESDWLASQPVRLSPPLGAPRLEQPEYDEKGVVKLSWTGIEGATSYLIEVARDAAFTQITWSEPMEETSCLFHPPSSGEYWFRVRASKGARNSDYSDSAHIVLRRPPPPRMWQRDPVAANSRYEVTWKGVLGSQFYEIQSSSTSTFDPDKTKTVRVFHPEQKLEVDGGAPGVVYYRVKAVDENSQASLWSVPIRVDIVDQS
ncbi:MAG: hypothetical protein GYB68_00970 [Chloroflexi bacterium]|nr:hypothetical protein [Chloroflexota bacterium]